jgi:hypothetical protein
LVIAQWFVSTSVIGSSGLVELIEEPADGQLYVQVNFPDGGTKNVFPTFARISKAAAAWGRLHLEVAFDTGHYVVKLDGTLVNEGTAFVLPLATITSLQASFGILPIITPTATDWTASFDNIVCSTM